MLSLNFQHNSNSSTPFDVSMDISEGKFSAFSSPRSPQESHDQGTKTIPSARKRNSGCLSIGTHDSYSGVFALRDTGCYPQGEFRKTRRFTENFRDPRQQSLYQMSPEDDFNFISDPFTVPTSQRTKNPIRRSSLQIPKAKWNPASPSDRRSPVHFSSSLSFNRYEPSWMEGSLLSTVRYNHDHGSSVASLSRNPSSSSYLRNNYLRLASNVTTANGYIKKGAWTAEEDALLLKFGGMATNKNWTEIAEHIPGRTAKQCRERWCFNLDPSIKKELWNPDEDKLLIEKQNEIGNKWAQIAQLLPGRTENAVKTRFKSIARARKREWRPAEDQLLLQLHKELGANWEGISAEMDSQRTKHAVKIRFKELQAGLVNLALPEFGSARQTVRESYYPEAMLPSISVYYQRIANGNGSISLSSNVLTAASSEEKQVVKDSQASEYAQPPLSLNQSPTASPKPSLKREYDSFDQTFDDFYSAMYQEEERLAA